MVLMLAAIVLLLLDDQSKRTDLQAAKQQLQDLTTAREQAEIARGASPAWFQERVEKAPALDQGAHKAN